MEGTLICNAVVRKPRCRLGIQLLSLGGHLGCYIKFMVYICILRQHEQFILQSHRSNNFFN